jgi:hypothetical protein
MTLPASPNALAVSNVNDETGRGTTTQTGIDWIRDNTKGGPTDFDSLHGLSYYTNNNIGNCNNDNCGAPVGGGNIQCVNCSLSTINCSNCDTQSYLQGGNCYTDPAPTYNCDQVADQAYNCNCACNCACFVCACACW